MQIVNNPNNSEKVGKELDDLFISLDELSKEERLLSLIRGGEKQTVEFKQTLSLNVATNQKDSKMELMVLKTICGFLNTEGGVLFVGVKDTGDICGIEKSLFPSNDKFLLHFKNLLKDQIGEKFYTLITYDLEKLLDKDLLVVKCQKSKEPIYLGKDGTFYVRSNPSTDELKGKDLVEYVKEHFKHLKDNN